ncbi:MAG TPA: ferredoxin [Acidimicrobiales bacterium]
MIRITIARERCVGSGNCLFWAPGTFTLDDEGVSVVIDPAADDEERITVAAEGCPTRAISAEPVGRPEVADEQEGPDADRTVR